MLRKKSYGGELLLKRRICAVKSVRLGSASTAVKLILAFFSSCGHQRARGQPDIVLLGDDRHVLEPGGGDPLADGHVDQRHRRRVAEHLRIALCGDLIGPHVAGHEGSAVLVVDLHLRQRDGAVELAEHGDHLVLLDQAFRRGAAFGRHAARVGIGDLDRPAEQSALRIDLRRRDLGGVLHVGAFGVATGRRQRTDPSDGDRLAGRACPASQQRQRCGGARRGQHAAPGRRDDRSPCCPVGWHRQLLWLGWMAWPHPVKKVGARQVRQL